MTRSIKVQKDAELADLLDAHRKRTEHGEQVAFIEWARTHPVARQFFAIPNGGLRHPVEANKLKAEGVLPGVPDLFLPVPAGSHHGLFIEMKVKGGKVSKEQKDRIRLLRLYGYAAVVAWGFDDARQQTEEYINHFPVNTIWEKV